MIKWYYGILGEIPTGPPNAYPMAFPRGKFLLINNEEFVNYQRQGKLCINSPKFHGDTLICPLETVC